MSDQRKLEDHELAEERLTMDYKIEVEWPTIGPDSSEGQADDNGEH